MNKCLFSDILCSNILHLPKELKPGVLTFWPLTNSVSGYLTIEEWVKFALLFTKRRDLLSWGIVKTE